MKLAVLMLLLLSEATTEDKTNTCPDRRHPTYHRRPQIFQKIWIHAPRTTTINTDDEEETGQSRIRRGHWTRLPPQVCFTPLYSVHCMCLFFKTFFCICHKNVRYYYCCFTKGVGEFKQDVERYQIIKD